ncbi:UNVERIFIED_CONTAM: Diphthine--ammonia ligase [Sesamum radiatum]|uniref:Diphthine--ammonia ligase n=1 Tax=Sesamum radiatum TaxID=300843 RepID=A0AAW2UT07_SESRA
MKVVALVSGGKDSCYAMMKCQEYGHEIVALANLMPVDEAQDELDSYMYQTVGHQIVVSYAQCMGIPLFRRRIQGSTRHHSLSYNMTPGDEVEDMFILLKEVKRRIPSVSAVSSGAIASDYQRLRVESVCSRLGLVSLAYLWKQDQSLLLQQMIRSGIIAIIVKVAAIGLHPSKHLGKEITHVEFHLHKLKDLYGINVCGEGGEYETLTLDCPLFKNARIVLDKFQVVLHSSDQIAPVGVLHPMEYHLENKLVSLSACDNDNSCEETLGEFDSVCEVLGDCQDICEAPNKKNDVISGLALDTKHEIHISESKKDNTISIACWLRDASKISSDLREDLKVVLTRIELLLIEYNCSWENVLYIHLYIADMNEFAPANEEYVKFITQEKCRFGVPSRSTIELPLLQAGLGRAYIEVLVSNDNTKNVLHVQSISEWAPSCIGPYSQLNSGRRPSMACSDDPISLYILVPDLQRGELPTPMLMIYHYINIACEVKPLLYCGENIGDFFLGVTQKDYPRDRRIGDFSMKAGIIVCLQKCIISGRLVTAVISVTQEIAGKRLSLISYCLQNLRIYFTASPDASHETLSTIFTDAFNEFGKMSRRIDSDKGSLFNLLPVLGAGRSATSLDNILTCELFARKS